MSRHRGQRLSVCILELSKFAANYSDNARCTAKFACRRLSELVSPRPTVTDRPYSLFEGLGGSCLACLDSSSDSPRDAK